MKKIRLKKGFTLIEIIICISLIAIISVGSFIGIKLVDKKILVSDLNSINDKILNATEVYIETNNETSDQLYTKQNAVVIPLVTLVNEGLLSLDGTRLDNDDIKNEYVTTFLGGTSSSDCVDIKTVTSWDETNSTPLYICTHSDGSSNLATIDPTKYSNKAYVSNEPYYFLGAYSDNYYYMNDNNYGRIFSIDRLDNIYVIPDKKTADFEYNEIGFPFSGAAWLTNKSEVTDIGGNYFSYLSLNYYALKSGCKIKSGAGTKVNKFKIEC